MALTLGKQRRLQQATSPRGVFTVLALDHRGPLRRRLTNAGMAGDVDEAVGAVKQDVVARLAATSTAVLLDPEIGLGSCVFPGHLPGNVGLLVALDTGSTGDPMRLETGLVEGWSPEAIARTGASGLKLLVYYHPEVSNAVKVEELVASVGRACAKEELPFYLEPLSYVPGSAGGSLASRDRRRVVAATARRLVPLGVDVLKAEFPVQVAEEPDEAAWREACQELDAACGVPWVVLSGGASFDVFLRQARVACEAGASGVIAGRSIWNEAVTVDKEARRRFLREAGRERMDRVRALCDALARPWHHRTTASQSSVGSLGGGPSGALPPP